VSNVVPFRQRAQHGRLPAAPNPAATSVRHGIAVALQAAPGAVTMIVGNEEDGAEVWLSPEEADSLGQDLQRFARAAKGLDDG
jgi:hypothetical protein